MYKHSARAPVSREAIMFEAVTYIHSHGSIGRTGDGSSACDSGGVLRVVRAVLLVLSLSLIQPRPRLPVTPLRPAEHYHTYGELDLSIRVIHRTRRAYWEKHTRDCTQVMTPSAVQLQALHWPALAVCTRALMIL